MSSACPSPWARPYTLRDTDMMESMVGGIRYEMVLLPDSMMDTTLFVGNLCEFCKDEDLSNLFQTVSTLQNVPACVARRPNFESLRYGFVTFLTVQEKEVSRRIATMWWLDSNEESSPFFRMIHSLFSIFLCF
jgi:hypothetical protein